MRINTLKSWMCLAAVAIAAPVLSQSAAKGQPKIVGTWQVQVTQVDCTSGTPLGPPFTSLLTFTAGHALFEDTSNPFFAAGQRGGGQGNWSISGKSKYAATSTAFIKFTTPPDSTTHNPGFEAGQQTISQAITFDDQTGQWSSTATVTFSDTTGTIYRQGCAVANGVPNTSQAGDTLRSRPTASAFSLPALAPHRGRLTVNIPFEFVVGNQTLPAGIYKFQPLLHSIPGKARIDVLEVRSAANRNYSALVADVIGSAGPSHPRLVFTRAGGRAFLSEVWEAEKQAGCRLQNHIQSTPVATAENDTVTLLASAELR